jgi:hypothetical protein
MREHEVLFDALILEVDVPLTKLGKSARIRELQLCKVIKYKQ